MKFSIDQREVGPGQPCLVIAEVAQAHDGSLGTAHAYIDAAARAGADAIKFQTHIAAAESTPAEPFRVRFSPQDATRYDYWKRMEFSEAQWQGLFQHARDARLIFLSTPFSFEAVELLDRLGVPAWKVASGEVTNLPMLARMAATGRGVMISSGMATWEELDSAVTTVAAGGAPVAMFQCTTSYPCPAECLGLNVLGELRQRYDCPVGLSDHSGTVYASLAAVALGANMLEVHVVLSRECFGPDVMASLTTSQLAELVAGVRFIERALAHPIDKQKVAREMSELKTIFGKSVVAARDLPAGHWLAEADLTLKKPGTGIPAARLGEFVGRRLSRPVAANTLLAEDHLD
ncbi:MAG TPA: N-acetylneuraminate synthase family protein [Pirellulales bacterium]|nr:N-acetylneuraminate synthase family protein [Pirellulales bacterium]